MFSQPELTYSNYNFWGHLPLTHEMEQEPNLFLMVYLTGTDIWCNYPRVYSFCNIRPSLWEFWVGTIQYVWVCELFCNVDVTSCCAHFGRRHWLKKKCIWHVEQPLELIMSLYWARRKSWRIPQVFVFYNINKVHTIHWSFFWNTVILRFETMDLTYLCDNNLPIVMRHRFLQGSIIGFEMHFSQLPLLMCSGI